MAYSQIKVAGVLADLMLGMSQREAATKHKVSRDSVRRWAKTIPESATKKEIGELVEEHLRSELRALGAIANAVQDPAWIAKYPPDSVAVLYGVMSDKAHVKLAALERVQREHQAELSV